MKVPQGLAKVDAQGRVMAIRLEKSLYGLRQASRNWNKVGDRCMWLRSYGLKPTEADPCAYVGNDKESGAIIIVILYVDDLMIAGPNMDAINRFKKAISQQFKMKDLGARRWMLGMEIIRDRASRTLEIKQVTYIDQIVARFGMSDCKSVATPAEGHLSRLDTESGSADNKYQQTVGSLIYAAKTTRVDMSLRKVSASG